MNTALKDKLYNITFTLHDLTHKPIPNLYYEIKNGKELVKKGNTNGQGEISLKYVGGNTLTVFVRKDIDKTMKKIGEIHTPSKNIKVKLISPKMKFDVTLLPHQEQGKYWRGTYKVKSGDTLSKIAKEHHTTVSALLALNPNIKSPNKIYQKQEIDIVEGNADAIIKLDENSTVKVPPVKSTGTVALDRKNKSSGSTPSASTDTKSKTTEQKTANTQPQPQQKPVPPPPQKIEVQQEHNEDKKPVAVASLSGCVCKDYDLIWGAKVNCAFRKKVVEISKELWGDEKKIKMANMLMAVFAWESGGTFKSNAPNQSNSGGTGLIQIMPKTYELLTKKKPTMEYTVNYWGKPKRGKPDVRLKRIKELANLTEVQYLDYVKQYFMPQKGKDLEFIDFYLQVLFPVSSGKAEHVVFADSLSKLPVIKGSNKKQDEKLESIRKLRHTAFSTNNMDGWILDEQGKAVRTGVRDGKVMKSEIAVAVSHYLDDGEKHKSDYSEHKGDVSPISTTKVEDYQKSKEKGEAEKSDCKDGCSIKRTTNSTVCLSGNTNCICQGIKVDNEGYITHPMITVLKHTRTQKMNKVVGLVVHRTHGNGKLASMASNAATRGTHFYIGNDHYKEDGKIVQALSLKNNAPHIGLNQWDNTKNAGWGNSSTVGIESLGLFEGDNMGAVGRWEEFTDKQARSLACLLTGLMKYYGFENDYDKVQAHEDICAKADYEGRYPWIMAKKYLHNAPVGSKKAIYRNGKYNRQNSSGQVVEKGASVSKLNLRLNGENLNGKEKYPVEE